MKAYLRMLTLFFILFTYNTVLSQEKNVELNGKIQSFGNNVSDILIINLNTNKATISDTLGRFKLEVRLRDSIKFSALQYISKKIKITDAVLNQKMLIVDLVKKVIRLDEVIVMPYNLTGDITMDIDRLDLEPIVTSSSLGLQNADINPMTQNERLLQEADRGTFVRMMTVEDRGEVMRIIGYATNFGIIINTHKIMNRVNGRTQYFRQSILRDETLVLEKDIIDIFSKKSMAEEFNIPETNIDGFLTYCLAQPDFSELLDPRNNYKIWQYLKDKSKDYKTLE